MSNIKVKVINKTTLELLEDAKAGDRIDLSDVQMIDTDFINELVTTESNKALKERLEEQKILFNKEIKSLEEKARNDAELLLTKKEAENNVVVNNLKTTYEEKITTLNSKITTLVAEAEKVAATTEADTNVKINNEVNKIKDTYIKEINELTLKISELKNTIDKNEVVTTNKINDEVNKIKEKLNNELINKEKELTDLKNKFEIEQQVKSKDLENQKLTLENSFNEKLQLVNEEKNKVTFELENLKLQKAHQNVKQLGEELESWCNEEYEAAKICGFEHCLWKKDNDSVKDELDSSDKKSKADYIFKMYVNDNFIQENEITSVCLEMKNESPDSIHTRTNESYYKKLDADRKKKNCEYALLVSELEWGENDAPIKKVDGFDKMYMVRPPYMITFLSIVYTLGKRYRDLILSVKEADEELKEIYEINEEFENFKVTYVEKPINSLSDQLAKMRKQASTIIDAANNINSEIDLITSKTIANIINKIQTFTIKKDKLVKKINKVQKD